MSSDSPPETDGLPSPANTLIDSMPIKSEPADTIMPLSLYEDTDAKLAIPSLDTTQHSAAMLCDLQCLSSRTGIARASQTHASSKSSSRFQTSQATRQWTNLFLHLIHLQIRTVYTQTLLGLWMMSPTRMQSLITRSQTNRSAMTHSSSTTSLTRTPLQPSRLTQLLAQPRAATSRVSQKGALAALARRPVLRYSNEKNVTANENREQDQTGQNNDGKLQEDGVGR